MTVLSLLPPAQYQAWQLLFELQRTVSVPWALIGGQLVALLAVEHGAALPRTTQDADVLVDVRAAPGGIETVCAFLAERGLELEGVTPEGVGHRFSQAKVRVGLGAVHDLPQQIHHGVQSGFGPDELPAFEGRHPRIGLLESRSDLVVGLVVVRRSTRATRRRAQEVGGTHRVGCISRRASGGRHLLPRHRRTHDVRHRRRGHLHRPGRRSGTAG